MLNNRIDTLKQFLKEDPEDSFVLFALAKEYEKAGILKSALDTYLELQSLDESYVGMYYHLGALYIELSEPQKALETYNKGMEIAKKQADFHALSELHGARNVLLED